MSSRRHAYIGTDGQPRDPQPRRRRRTVDLEGRWHELPNHESQDPEPEDLRPMEVQLAERDRRIEALERENERLQHEIAQVLEARAREAG